MNKLIIFSIAVLLFMASYKAMPDSHPLGAKQFKMGDTTCFCSCWSKPEEITMIGEGL